MSIALQEQVRALLGRVAELERSYADLSERLQSLEKKAAEAKKPLGLAKP